MFIEMARSAAKRATCHRLNVGAIVTHQNSPISVGWNGQEPGAPHCAGNDCPGIVPGRCGTLHAEINALTKAASVFKPWGATVDLYCTHSPCRLCAEFILNDTPMIVERIFFEIPYRDTSHLGMFQNSPVEVFEVTPSGYVVDYFSRKVVELA